MNELTPPKKSSVHVILVTLCALNLAALLFMANIIRVVGHEHAVAISRIADDVRTDTASAPSVPASDADVKPALGCPGDYFCGGSETPTYDGWDLKFNYPAEWHVQTEEDAEWAGQRNIRITSQPGTLWIRGGAAVPQPPGSFALGAQIVIRELHVFHGEEELVRLPTADPDMIINRGVSECENAGCPTAYYIITMKDGGGTYEVVLDVVGDNFDADRAVAEAIVTSLRKN